MTIEECRHFYAKEIRFAANLRSKPLIDAFSTVPREKFLPPPPWTISSSGLTSPDVLHVETNDPEDLYHNVLVSIDPSRRLNNGLPAALATWIEALDLRCGDRVFHFGSGVGYYTAIMAEVTGPEGHVLAVEIDPDLAARSVENLAAYPNVRVHCGDAATLDPGPCDAIFVNAGVTHPNHLWLERLSGSGRLVLPLTTSMAPNLGRGAMLRVSREDGCWRVRLITSVAIYSSTSLRDTVLERQINKAFEEGTLFQIKSLRLDRHEKEDTCVVHSETICWSAADIKRQAAD
jgi:protein-L-isoaspartate(D-aspartate) O-methyltransferase